MQRLFNASNVAPVTEMAIVDTFTKLIFGDEAYSEQESLIIDAFRSVCPDVQRDSCQEMGGYLRNLGVREMIQLVSRLRQHISEQVETPVSIRNRATPGANVSAPGRDRGFH
jgi:hypothetical protein